MATTRALLARTAIIALRRTDLEIAGEKQRWATATIQYTKNEFLMIGAKMATVCLFVCLLDMF